ncbi:MAG: hypothetical protein K0R69_3305 [Clostridia bacterium]|jgi:hypothetical protein|nr:hypothetical protein [Clostridia bacterium]
MANKIHPVRINGVKSEAEIVEVITRVRTAIDRLVGQTEATGRGPSVLDGLLLLMTKTSLALLDTAIEAGENGKLNQGFDIVSKSQETLDKIKSANEVMKSALDAINANSGQLTEVVTEALTGAVKELVDAGDKDKEE